VDQATVWTVSTACTFLPPIRHEEEAPVTDRDTRHDERVPRR